jgi:hypothetical protein
LAGTRAPTRATKRGILTLAPADSNHGRALVGVLTALTLLGACSKRVDPKACKDRIARMEERFGKVAEPTVVAQWAGGFDVPRAPRQRTQPLGADGLFVGTGYDARSFGRFEAFSGAPEQGRPDVDATHELRRFLREQPALPTSPIPVYVAVPTREHALLHLVDVLATVDPIFELRLVVGVEGTEIDPVPADASDWVREPFQKLAGPYASERYQAIDAVWRRAVGDCEALRQQLFSKAPPREVAAAMASATQTCGCGVVDVPALEAVVAWLFFKLGDPELAWIPLELHGTGTVQELAAGTRASTKPEPGLGDRCRTAADCPATASKCLPIGADGTWSPGGQGHCTRPCGAGCPDGFRCTREVSITGVAGGHIQGRIDGTWCGPIAERAVKPNPP